MSQLRGGTTIGGYTALHSGLKESYLGGNLTINGNITLPTSRIRDNNSGSLIISSTGVDKAIYLRPDGDLLTSSQVAIKPTGVTFDGQKMWHAGNDGTGSGLDADLLDGRQASQFQQHILTNGVNSISASTDWNNYADTGFYMGSSMANQPTTGSGMHTWKYMAIQQHNSTYTLQTSADFNGKEMHFRTKQNAAWQGWNRVWHDGNDGSGSGLDADSVDGLQAASFMRTDADDTFSGKHIASARRAGIYGTYSSTLIDHVWSMGSDYMVDSGGANFGSLYGMAYKHTNNGTGGTMAGGHQIVFTNAGSPGAAIGLAGNFWTSGSLTVGRSGVLMADASLKNTSTGRLDVAANLVSLNGGTVNIGEGIVNNTTMNVHGDSNFYGTGNTFDGTIWNNGGISGTGSIETQGSLTAGGNALVTQLIASAASAAVRFTGGGTQYHLEADSTGFNIVQTGVAGGQRLRVKNDGDIEAGNRLYVSKHYRSTVVSITSTGWYNIASNPGNRASARFKLMSTEGGGHQMTEIIASAAYNRQSESDISLLSRGGYATGDRIAAVRLLTGGTYDTMYIQVYIHANATMQFYMYDNDWESGWTPMHFTAGGIPAGYSATKMELHAGVKRANVFTSSSPPNAKGAYPGDIWIQY